MASASILLSEEQSLCSICMDVFTDPITTPCGHNYCKTCITHYWDTNVVCQCPLCNKTFSKNQEFSVNKVLSEIADQFRDHKLKEEYEAKTEAEVQQMIQERQLKIQEVKQSVELSRKDADTVIAVSGQVFTALISRIELIDVIEEEQKTTEKQAEDFINELQQEITQLEKRSSQLKQLSQTEDHLLHNFPSISSGWRPTKDWTKVIVHQSSLVGTVRTAVAQLEKKLSQEMKKKLCVIELRMIRKYQVDVTLDPDTAHPNFILSEDGKQVSCGTVRKNLPDNTERFSRCPCVLGKQIFAGRFYYEVQVTGKTEWSLGVARESIDRKKQTLLSPKYGNWTIVLRNGKYWAAAGPGVLLPVREELQKVGVFVDYEEGLVSFYDVETRVHLYSYTGCTFTEKLFPFFSAGRYRGRNPADLIISPAKTDAELGEDGGNMLTPLQIN